MISPWLFNVYIRRQLNVRLLGIGFELLGINCSMLERNQLLFADDTALAADHRSCVDWCVSLVEYAKEES